MINVVNFKTLLKQRNVTLLLLQEKVGISKATYSKIINGEYIHANTEKTVNHWIKYNEKKKYKYKICLITSREEEVISWELHLSVKKVLLVIYMNWRSGVQKEIGIILIYPK